MCLAILFLEFWSFRIQMSARIPPILACGFHVFSQSMFRQMLSSCLKFGHDIFLPQNLQFILHYVMPSFTAMRSHRLSASLSEPIILSGMVTLCTFGFRNAKILRRPHRAIYVFCMVHRTNDHSFSIHHEMIFFGRFHIIAKGDY